MPAATARILPEAQRDPRYDPSCRRCARLASFLDLVREEHPDYWCKPVAPFGDARARLVIVGLAPGMHGANASGRPFTGDYAGILLYETLHAFGWANQPHGAAVGDGLTLRDCRVTNAVKCLPPQNKPLRWKSRTATAISPPTSHCCRVVQRCWRWAASRTTRRCGALRAKPRDYPFAHGARHRLDEAGVALFDSYHCSRYNTNTRRLTPDMFRAVFQDIAAHLA